MNVLCLQLPDDEAEALRRHVSSTRDDGWDVCANIRLREKTAERHRGRVSHFWRYCMIHQGA